MKLTASLEEASPATCRHTMATSSSCAKAASRTVGNYSVRCGTDSSRRTYHRHHKEPAKTAETAQRYALPCAARAVFWADGYLNLCCRRDALLRDVLRHSGTGPWVPDAPIRFSATHAWSPVSCWAVQASLRIVIVVAAPEYDLSHILVPMFVAMIAWKLWLWIKGSDPYQWDDLQVWTAVRGQQVGVTSVTKLPQSAQET